MRIVLDNDVIIGALYPNPEFEAAAQEVLRLAAAKKMDGFVSANSLTDIFYVLRREHGADKAKSIIRKLLLFLDIIGTEPADCVAALEKEVSDFEDALVEVCARKINADYIVSRDEKFIRAATEVELIKPADLIAQFK
ncbi:MAG: PIN domain-containing protein [Clostridiales Family XIII bacterium]|jgi:predicted nucleic acid-binding protein|nr:PIN domain-containing protein [Clostridiales Family XIII bacterium]